MTQRAWLATYWVLLVAVVLTAALNMLHVRGGFLTNHLADVAVPAWMYVTTRGRYSARGRHTFVQRVFGRSPEFTALGLFVASALTELSQFYWPHGLFPGRFDILDVAAYAGGLAACYLADRRWPSRAASVMADGRAAGP